MSRNEVLTHEERELAEMWESVENMNHFGCGQYSEKNNTETALKLYQK